MPANETDTDCRPVFERLKALFDARKVFTDVENSSRLKKALRVRPQQMELYETGDKAYYKFGTDTRWHGPGTIIGIDNKVIFLRHGGNMISTSQSRLLKVKTSRSDTDTSLPNPRTESSQKVPLSVENRISQIGNRNTESDMDSDEEIESEESPSETHEIPLNTEEPEEIIQTENHARNKPEKKILPKKGDMIEYKNKDEERRFGIKQEF